MDRAFTVEVECDAEQGGEPVPARFRLGARTVEVREILDRWPGADRAYVKLLGADGAIYILRHEPEPDRWQLVLYDRGAAPDAGSP